MSNFFCAAIMLEDIDSGIMDLQLENVTANSRHEAMGILTDKYQAHGTIVHKVRALLISGDAHDARISEYLELMQRGQKIAAIKLRREHSGEGLKDAKDFIDNLQSEHQAYPTN